MGKNGDAQHEVIWDVRLMEEMDVVIDCHFHVHEMNSILKAWIQAKMQKKSMWGDITRCIHFMLGGNSSHIHRIVAYTELVILALDIIDDLEDKDNSAMPWMQLPHAITLNAAVALLMAVVGEISKLKESNGDLKLPLVGEVNQLLSFAANGQHQDICSEVIESEEDYIALIFAKSAPLMVFACYMGYSCVDQCELSTKDQINELACNLAVVAQIQNDIKDLISFNVKHDLINKKRTLPILYLLTECSQRYPIFKDYYDGRVSLEPFLEMKEACISFILKSGCVEYSRVIQGLYLNKVEEIFNSIPGTTLWKNKFWEVVIAQYRILFV
ncbi:polyprenyl synthetase family protein [Paenibacillus sp. SI8]|uniref:polyprenyl synthetase family protein n=1 Tax=unclassified Paenibacillus TaxID=185978 RepID=UPI00346794C8